MLPSMRVARWYSTFSLPARLSSWIVRPVVALEGLAGRGAEVLPHRERRLGARPAHGDREAVLALRPRGRHDRTGLVAPAVLAGVRGDNADHRGEPQHADDTGAARSGSAAASPRVFSSHAPPAAARGRYAFRHDSSRSHPQNEPGRRLRLPGPVHPFGLPVRMSRRVTPGLRTPLAEVAARAAVPPRRPAASSGASSIRFTKAEPTITPSANRRPRRPAGVGDTEPDADRQAGRWPGCATPGPAACAPTDARVPVTPISEAAYTKPLPAAVISRAAASRCSARRRRRSRGRAARRASPQRPTPAPAGRAGCSPPPPASASSAVNRSTP